MPVRKFHFPFLEQTSASVALYWAQVRSVGDCGMVRHLVKVYRQNAAHCVEIAREFSNPTDKRLLLDMAQAWLRLCEINEKFDHALQEAEPTAPSSLRRQRPLGGISLNY